MSAGIPAITLREWTGPLTSELVLQPGRFGLGMVPGARRPASVARAVCGYCSTGCGLKIHLDDSGSAVNLTADPSYPVNRGMACPKGWEALTPLAASDRAVTPLLDGKPVDWDCAMQMFCGRFRRVIEEYGGEAAAFLSTGQIMSEEMAFLGVLAKSGMGIVHGDGNTRQCMATAVAAYKQSFGFDSPPYTYEDFEESDVLVFVGSNPCIAHPILWQRVLNNRRRPEIVVIDPRLTESAMAATLHLAIRPKTDLLFLYCLAAQLIRDGCVDRAFVEAHTSGFEEFATFLEDYRPEDRLRETGIDRESFEALAKAIAGGKRVSFWWTMGVNQGHEATRTAQAIINLALMTGNIGRPGTGANSITGQCNAMGSRLFSNTTNLTGGHDFANPEHRRKVAEALRIPGDRIPEVQGFAYDRIVDEIAEGRIRALWMIGTNGAHSWIQQDRFREAIRKLDFFCVQDMYANTASAQLAHLVLPAAGWGEKEGTFINSERRIGVSRKVARAPGQALADFHIFRLIAHYWGCGRMFAEWTSPEAVFEMLKAVTRGQPCDIGGIAGYDMLEECGGVQWPLREGDVAPGERPATHRRLFADGRFFTPDGRARFVQEAPRSVPEPVCREYPFVLLTGRGTSAQWHTQTRTGKSAILRKLHPASLLLDIHPLDARARGIAEGDRVCVISRRAEIEATARLTATVQRMQVFLPMHDPAVNRLTLQAVDPVSRQPAFKHCAVRVERRKKLNFG